MTNVLIIGAAGYIGQALVGSLVRSGEYRVYGHARTGEKAKLLASQEVIPFQGSIGKEDLSNVIAVNYINVIVDVAGDAQISKDLLEALKTIGQVHQAAAREEGVRAPKFGLVYVSGAWVHGSSDLPVNDLAPVGTRNAPTPPARLVSWRTAFEQEVIAASSILDTMVVRPALVYGRFGGRSGAIWSGIFSPLLNAATLGLNETSIPSEPDSRPGLCHVDDVASGVHCAIDRLPLISGTGVYPVFDLTTGQESMREIAEAAAKVFGFSGEVKLMGTQGNLFMEACSTSFNGNSARAIQLLGWQPKKRGFIQGMDVYAKAWLAGQKEMASS